MIGLTGVVLNEANEVLVLYHRYWKGSSWGLPSGYLDKGEHLEQGFAREVMEETGISIEEVEVVSLRGGFRLRLEVTLLARVTGGQALRIDHKEIKGAVFVHPDDLPASLRPQHREAVRMATSRETR